MCITDKKRHNVYHSDSKTVQCVSPRQQNGTMCITKTKHKRYNVYHPDRKTIQCGSPRQQHGTMCITQTAKRDMYHTDSKTIQCVSPRHQNDTMCITQIQGLPAQANRTPKALPDNPPNWKPVEATTQQRACQRRQPRSSMSPLSETLSDRHRSTS